MSLTRERPNVLLVDDRPENLLALEAVLAPLHCRCVSVTSGEDALKRLLAEEFALVLLDVQMPGLDGFETAELIKARERTRALPIIFVTAISKERQHVFRGYTTGAVDYVFKPYDPAVLRSKVAVFLELDDRARAAAAGEALYRATFACAPIGMARLDTTWRIVEVNAALARMLGRREEELSGLLLDALVRPGEAAPDAGHRADLLSGRAPTVRGEAVLRGPADEEVPCALSFSLAQAAGKVPDAVLVQVEDLRERRRAEAEREQLLREQAARAQAEAVSARMSAVQRITDAALQSLGFDDLVRELLTRTTEALTVDTAAIVLREDDGGATVFQAAGGVDAGVQKRREAADAVDGSHPLGDAVTSTLEVPLLVDGDAIGALHVGSLFARRFTGEDRSVLTLAAERAGLALQRMRLFERERVVADELQRSLLPDALPALPGFAAAARYRAGGAGTEVGGDWYDALVQRTGELLLVVGDVAGRGIAAAAAMGRLRSALRAYAVDGHGPGAILSRLNALQLELGADEMATAVIVGIHPVSGRLRCASAGHLPPLLLDDVGTAHWLEVPRGAPLGAVPDLRYDEVEVDHPLGSTLVLYTDGLVEARGEALDAGLARLRGAALSAPAPEELEPLADHLLREGAASGAAEDDVTLLVLRRADVRAARLELEVPGTGMALKVLRITVRRWLEAAGADRDAVDDVTMALNEAVQNAIEHGHSHEETPVQVTLSREDGDDVRIDVHDHGGWREPTAGDRGRGLALMRGLMDGVEVVTDGPGTTVRLRRALRSSSRAA